MTHQWLAPDAHPPDAQELPTRIHPYAAEAETSAEQDVPSPVPLRPMTVADILDGGVAVIKAAPRTVFVIAGAFVIPLELVSAWVQRDSLADRGLAGAITAATSSSSDSNSGWTVASILLVIASGVVLSLVAGAIAHLVSSCYADKNPTAGDAIKASLRYSPALIVAWIVVHLMEAVGTICFGVGLLFVLPLVLVVAPVIVVERLGPWAGVRRSTQLTRVRYGAALGTTLLIAVVSYTLTIALSGLGLAFSFFSWGWIVDVICRGASTLVTVPFVAGATTLAYLDLRIRAEGLDLELDIAEHFQSVR